MCWYCGSPITESEPLGRSARCACGKDLRCCRHCRFFLPSGGGSRGDCSEPNAEPEQDKERAVFCDWFSLNQKFRSPTPGQAKARAAAGTAQAAFNSLFSKD